MPDPFDPTRDVVAPILSAPQHGPRPLPLFLAMLRSETGGDAARMEAVLAGVRAYQQASRVPRPLPMPALAERHGALLRDYGGTGPLVLFVPSLINPPHVLDLSAGRSLLRWLSRQGLHPLLLDWGQDVTPRRHLSIADHVTEIIVPLVSELPEPPLLVGYCLGGTMAIAAASLAPVKALVTIAAPWQFGAYPQEARAGVMETWRGAAPIVEALGLLPMEVLQSLFWQLDPARTIGKFAAFASDPGDGSFVALEDWANDGPPLPGPAGRELFEAFYQADLTGRGEWTVGGRAIDPAGLPCPLLNIVSTTDRIVPAAASPMAGERLELPLGHVGMVVGGRARAALWEPLAAWLSQHATS